MIRIKQSHKLQYLMIGHEIEGKVYRQPDAQYFGCAAQGPGAISASLYTYGFILPAWLRPKGTGLVYGLGAGAGVVLLLALFPELSLTVVEVNPQLIAYATLHFPLIQHYIDQQRLRLVNQNAFAYLGEPVDFTLIDIYSGDEAYRPNLELLPRALACSTYVVVNLIGRFSAYDQDQLLSDFPGCLLFPCYDDAATQSGNWVLTNITQLPEDMTMLNPFPGLEQANRLFSQFLRYVPARCFYSE